jgi:hypothetical protein
MWNLLTEMPQRIPPTGDEIVREILDKGRDYLFISGKREGKFDDMYVRSVQVGTRQITYIFLNDQDIVAVYAFGQSSLKNVFQTLKSWRNEKYQGIFYKIFMGYILPKMKNVESDIKLSDQGKDFWKRLMDKNPQYKFIIKTPEGLLEIDDSSLLDEYFGDDKSYQNFTFIVAT